MCGINEGGLSFHLEEIKPNITLEEYSENCVFSALDIGGLCMFTLSVIDKVTDVELNREQLWCTDGELRTIDNKDLYVLRWLIE